MGANKIHARTSLTAATIAGMLVAALFSIGLFVVVVFIETLPDNPFLKAFVFIVIAGGFVGWLSTLIHNWIWKSYE